MKKRTELLVLSIMAASMGLLGNTHNIMAEEQKYYLTNEYDGSTARALLDTGFSKTETINKDDPHYGWSLGKFYIEGYTEITTDDEGIVVLVNAGDSITFGYELTQDINALNGKTNWRIDEDDNGYDLEYEISKSQNGFGRGTLLVKYTNPNNEALVQPPYVDYLSAIQSGVDNTTISYLEEGDYEGSLDYQIVKPGFLNIPDRYNYKTSFSFKVRNSNCMIFPRSISDDSELVNYSVAPNGFYLDYANSHYLSVIVKRESLMNDGTGYSKCIRECKSASDGKACTENGIYTIIVTNNYTEKSVEMILAVGDDPITNAYVASNCSYDPMKIEEMIDSGIAEITADWKIQMIENKTTEVPETVDNQNCAEVEDDTTVLSKKKSVIVTLTLVALTILAMAGVIIYRLFKRK